MSRILDIEIPPGRIPADQQRRQQPDGRNNAEREPCLVESDRGAQQWKVVEAEDAADPLARLNEAARRPTHLGQERQRCQRQSLRAWTEGMAEDEEADTRAADDRLTIEAVPACRSIGTA